MALAININDLLNKQKLESNRIEFKKGWNPGSIYHSICAFAIPIHEGCGESSETDLLGSETHNESSERKKLVRRQPQKVRREMLIQLKMYIIV